MTSSRMILKRLKDPNQYLQQFPQSQRSTYFEQIVAEAFSRILHLPFCASDNEDTNVPYRVIWQGSISPLSNAPPGKPDVVAYCYDFYLIIEATLKTGANQWAQEFAPSIRHCEDFCSQKGIPQKDVPILLVCTKLYRDTYRSIKNNPTQEHKFIPIEVSVLSRILETSILAFTMRHLELRRLINGISDCITNSSSVDIFSNSVDDFIISWQKDVLTLEKSAFVGVKSYEVMRKIGRNNIGVSEVLQNLQKHPIIKRYFKIIDDKIGMNIISESLVQQSLASRLAFTCEGEEVFESVPCADFKGRSMRLIDAVEGIVR